MCVLIVDSLTTKPARDLGVGETARDELHHLQLARREPTEPPGRGPVWRRGGELRDQAQRTPAIGCSPASARMRPRGLDPVQTGHLDVHEHDARGAVT